MGLCEKLGTLKKMIKSTDVPERSIEHKDLIGYTKPSVLKKVYENRSRDFSKILLLTYITLPSYQL